jgi:hypothetical protein
MDNPDPDRSPTMPNGKALQESAINVTSRGSTRVGQTQARTQSQSEHIQELEHRSRSRMQPQSPLQPTDLQGTVCGLKTLDNI